MKLLYLQTLEIKYSVMRNGFYVNSIFMQIFLTVNAIEP